MFGRFLDWFERHKFGVVGTLMLHTLMLFAMAMSKLPQEKKDKEEPEMVMELATPEELPPDPTLQPPLLAGEPVRNLTSNITASSSQPRMYLSRGAQERLSSAVEEDLRSFEAEEFAKLAEERKLAGKEVEMPHLDPSKWEKEQYMKKEPQPVKVEGLTTVSVDLVGRVDIHLDVPAYLCEGQGQVVVRITVARDGTVAKADEDAARTRADECMVEHALSSARAARFTSNSSAPDPQHGTITYTFLAQ